MSSEVIVDKKSINKSDTKKVVKVPSVWGGGDRNICKFLILTAMLIVTQFLWNMKL